MSTQRVQRGHFPRIGPLAWLLAHAGGRLAGSEPLTLFLTLGRNRRQFLGWLHFAATLMPFGRLPRHEAELVILRVAHLRRCDYERVQHERIGRRAGLADTDLDRVTEGPDAAGWTDRERALLRAVDEFVVDRDVTDATWLALREHLDERAVVELCLLAGHYDMLGRHHHDAAVASRGAGPALIRRA